MVAERVEREKLGENKRRREKLWVGFKRKMGSNAVGR